MKAMLMTGAAALGLLVSGCATTAGTMSAGEVPAYMVPVVETTAVSRAADCDRACLEGMVDAYFAAVIADDPSMAPLSPDVRFTENGQLLPLTEGLWKSMKSAGGYRLFVTDADAGQVTLLTTVTEDGRQASDPGIPAILALRLKVENGLITEIEQDIERNPDSANRIEAMGSPRPGLLAVVPEAERMSRADMIVTANKYFTGMASNDGKGDYPFADDCNRIENGGQSTNVPTPAGQTRPDPATSLGYSGQWTCREQFESGLLHFVTQIRDRRYVAVDQERGLVAAFAFFDHVAGSTRTFQVPDGRTVTAGPSQPWTWQIYEIFKIQDGQIHEIEAFLTRPPYGMISGWSTWEDGHSQEIFDVTGYTEE
jgi:hypothetical protein